MSEDVTIQVKQKRLKRMIQRLESLAQPTGAYTRHTEDFLKDIIDSQIKLALDIKKELGEIMGVEY